MAQRTGYRIAAEAVDAETENRKLVTTFYWVNRGAAPCYEKFEICAGLYDKTGKKLWSSSQMPACGCSPVIWDSKAHFADTLEWELPDLPAGEYQLCFGIRQKHYGKEMMMLANSGRTPEGWYPAGTISIK